MTFIFPLALNGGKMSLLRRHLSQVRGLTPEAYRAKWKLANDYALSGENYRKDRQGGQRLDVSAGAQLGDGKFICEQTWKLGPVGG